MWSFLNIRNSCPGVYSKKGVLKIKILQNSSKNICDAVFKLIKFQVKDQQLCWKQTLGCVLFVECRQNATSEIFSKNQSSSRLIFRRNQSQIFFKISILQNFTLVTGKYLWWRLFLIKLQVWIIESLLQFTCVTCFNSRNHTQSKLKLHHSQSGY